MEDQNENIELTETEESECPIMRLNRDYQPSILTEKERWECTVRWLNRLYHSGMGDEPFEMPCDNCPYAGIKCLINKKDTWIPALEHFGVLERFTGKGTVVGHHLRVGL